LLLFSGGLPPPRFSNKFAGSDGLLKLFPLMFPNRLTSSGLLRLLFPADELPPPKFLNGCYPRLLVSTFCPNIPNLEFWLLPYVTLLVVPNMLLRFSNVITIG